MVLYSNNDILLVESDAPTICKVVGWVVGVIEHSYYVFCNRRCEIPFYFFAVFVGNFDMIANSSQNHFFSRKKSQKKSKKN